MNHCHLPHWLHVQKLVNYHSQSSFWWLCFFREINYLRFDFFGSSRFCSLLKEFLFQIFRAYTYDNLIRGLDRCRLLLRLVRQGLPLILALSFLNRRMFYLKYTVRLLPNIFTQAHLEEFVKRGENYLKGLRLLRLTAMNDTDQSFVFFIHLVRKFQSEFNFWVSKILNCHQFCVFSNKEKWSRKMKHKFRDEKISTLEDFNIFGKRRPDYRSRQSWKEQTIKLRIFE